MVLKKIKRNGKSFLQKNASEEGMLEYLKSPGKDHQWILTPVDERVMEAGSFHVSTCHHTDYLSITRGNVSLYSTEMSGHHFNQAV